MSRTQCPKCNANRGLAQYDNGEWCFSCSYFNPSKSLVLCDKQLRIEDNLDYVDNLLPIYNYNEYSYLKQYYITKSLCDKHNVKYDQQSQRILFPYYDRYERIAFLWGRSVKQNQLKWLFKGNKFGSLFYLKQSDKRASRKICVVEDVISAIRVSQYCDVIALGGTNSDNKLLVPLFLQYDEILLWLDGDEAGRKAAQKLRSKLKLIRKTKIIRTLKDPKCTVPSEMIEILQKCYEDIKI